MSTGHRRYDKKTPEELKKILAAGDTPQLLRKPYRLDTSHTVAYGGGVSVDAKAVYIDHILYCEIMQGKVRVKGMSQRQIIERICAHEHGEYTIMIGDNAVDWYPPAHEFATTYEHMPIRNPEQYERDMASALERCARRPQTNPPKDLWCGPYIDQPDKQAKDIIRQYKAKGVTDAFKVSKYEVHYSIGPEECRDCANFNEGKGPLRICDLVSGLVRDKRWCDRWKPRKEK